MLSALANAVPNAPLGSSLLSIKNITWQELEELEPNFLQLLVSSFNSMAVGLEVEFQDIWCSAKASANILQMKLKIPTVFEIGTEKQQWIIETKKNTQQRTFQLLTVKTGLTEDNLWSLHTF